MGKKLIVLAQEFEEKLSKSEGEYGGKGPLILPKNHKAGVIVPKGGSCCANCKFGEMKDDGPHCNSPNWQIWNGGESRLPVDDPETYCSDFWEPQEK